LKFCTLDSGAEDHGSARLRNCLKRQTVDCSWQSLYTAGETAVMRVNPAIEKLKNRKRLDVYLRDRDHVDVKTIEGSLGLRPFIAAMLSYYPRWIILLYRIREVFVGILGLARHDKPDRLPKIEAQALPFQKGERAIPFIVQDACEDAYWVPQTPPYRHLTAFFGVVAEELGGGRNRFYVFTVVKYLHWTGPVYFNIIRSFNHLVVSSKIRAGVRQSSMVFIRAEDRTVK
jgi:hypothetical protein